MPKRLLRLPKTSKIHKSVRFGQGCILEEDVRIGANVTIGDRVQLSSHTIIHGPARIGKNSYIGSSCIIGYPPRQELKRLIRGEELHRGQGHAIDIGANCIIRSGCILYSKVHVGSNVEMGHNVLIREETTIGSGTMVGTNTVVDGYSDIGENVRIQTGVYISPFSTVRGNVFLGPCCMLLNDKYLMQTDFPLKGPTIESGASIGGNAVILPAVTIREAAVVGAGAVVVRDVPPREIHIGIPARRLKSVPDEWMIKLGKS